MNTQKAKKIRRSKRKYRIRSRISGTAKRPRLSVFRSNKALYVQFIDDTKGTTLLSRFVKGRSKELARTFGHEVGKAAKASGIKQAVFDRSGYRYHGIIQEIAQSVREEGVAI